MADDFLGYELEEWLPTLPIVGPPLPIWMGITWPWYKPPVAELRVSNLQITPAEVQVGYPVSISCLVENIGTEEGTKTIEYRLEGVKVAEQIVTLAPGESKTISFELTPTVAKTYSVTVDGQTGTFKAVKVPVADIRVENLIITPSEVSVGKKVTISVTAQNYGTAAGTKKIVCTVT